MHCCANNAVFEAESGAPHVLIKPAYVALLCIHLNFKKPYIFPGLSKVAHAQVSKADSCSWNETLQ